MKLIDQRISELKKLCDRYHVSELYVFGSVAKDKFTDKSDIDFLVRFSGVDLLITLIITWISKTTYQICFHERLI